MVWQAGESSKPHETEENEQKRESECINMNEASIKVAKMKVHQFAVIRFLRSAHDKVTKFSPFSSHIQ